jgi:hypothetical protein
MGTSQYQPGAIHCEGAAFDDFRLTDHLPPETAPAVIERDRLHMAARPGFNRKLLPLRIEPDTGAVYSGGRYLLDTYEDARAFADWCEHDFVLDGVPILQRPDFADVTTAVWRVIGAWDFKDIHQSQQVYRTEIWSLSKSNAGDTLANQWNSLRDQAAEQDRSGLWLLYDEDSEKACIVTIAEGTPDASKSEPDFRGIRSLEQAPSQGAAWEKSGWANKVFDRTHWVFTIWFPRVDGQDVEPPLWPNSPPLPAA